MLAVTSLYTYFNFEGEMDPVEIKSNDKRRHNRLYTDRRAYRCVGCHAAFFLGAIEQNEMLEWIPSSPAKRAATLPVPGSVICERRRN